MTQLSHIREKLDLIGVKYLWTGTLQKLIDKFAPSYTASQLCDTGMISPLKRGSWYTNNINRDIEDPYQIASIYFGDVRYMFGGLGVYQIYGYSTQLVEWHTVYNTQISGERIIGKTKFIFRKQRERFFYGVTTAESSGVKYNIMSRERALIQILSEGKTFNTLPRGIDRDLLMEMAEKHASKNTIALIKNLCS